MENLDCISLHYGYLEGEDGIYHTFAAEDPSERTDSAVVARELAARLGTVPEDASFNWDTLTIRIPEKTVVNLKRSGIRISRESALQPRNTYTLEHFKPRTNEKRITATGWLAADKIAQCINYSSILSSLIKTAGRLVDSYASDLIISWNSIMNELDLACMNALNPETDSAELSRTYLFGFREMGVDDEKAILAWYNDAGGNHGHYREIWRLDIDISATGNIRAELYNVNKSV